MSNNNYLLTFHMTWSYGACLQAFATLEALKNVGCKAEILISLILMSEKEMRLLSSSQGW